MTPRAVLTRLAWVAATLLAGAEFTAAQDTTLRASAGLAGHVRPGRWTAVQVDVTRSGPAINGELVVEWGPARIHRLLSLNPGTPRQIELYIRTLDPRDVIGVRLVSDGVTIARTDVQVRIVPHDAESRLVVCGPQAAATTQGCLAVLAVADVPLSWRGYDGADGIRLSDLETRSLSAPQQSALALARARLSRAEHGSPAIGVIPTGRRSTQSAGVLLGGYAAAFAMVLIAARFRYPYVALATSAISTGLGVVAVAATGLAGDVVVHHASVLEQYEGANRGVLTLRGIAEVPTAKRITLRSEVDDAALFATQADGEEVIAIDRSGFPILAGRFGRGGTVPLTFEGTVAPLLRVSRDGHDLRLTNVSNHTLKGCVFSAAPSTTLAELAPGDTASRVAREEDVDATFTCTIEGDPWSLSESGRAVEMDGASIVVLYLDPALNHVASGPGR